MNVSDAPEATQLPVLGRRVRLIEIPNIEVFRFRIAPRPDSKDPEADILSMLKDGFDMRGVRARLEIIERPETIWHLSRAVRKRIARYMVLQEKALLGSECVVVFQGPPDEAPKDEEAS